MRNLIYSVGVGFFTPWGIDDVEDFYWLEDLFFLNGEGYVAGKI